jgi:hypothetical protein
MTTPTSLSRCARNGAAIPATAASANVAGARSASEPADLPQGTMSLSRAVKAGAVITSNAACASVRAATFAKDTTRRYPAPPQLLTIRLSKAARAGVMAEIIVVTANAA